MSMQFWRNQKSKVILLAILVMAIGLRLWGIQFGLPDYFYIDSPKTVMPAKKIAYSFLVGHPNLDPGFYQYPTLPTNLLAAEYIAYGAINGWLEMSQNSWRSWTEAVNIVYQAGDHNFYLLGRLTSAAASTLTILILYLIAVNSYKDRRVALVSAFFLASMFLHNKNAKYEANDALMGFMAIWAWLYILKIAGDGKRKDYAMAGLLIGMATATKYLPIFLLFPTGLAFLFNFKHPKENLRGLIVNIFICLSLVPIGFFIATPSFLFRSEQFIQSVSVEKKGQYDIGGKPGDVQQGYFDYLFSQSPTYNEPLAINSLMGSMGLPLLMLSLVGLFYGLHQGIKKRFVVGNTDLILALSCLLFYFALAHPGQLRTVRHFYLFLPIYSLLAGRVLVSATNKILPMQKYWAIPLAAFLIASPTLWRTIRFDYLYTQIDNRYLASQWINNNLAAGSTIMVPNMYFPNILPNKFAVFFYDRTYVNRMVLDIKSLNAMRINYFVRSSFFEDRYFTEEALKEFPEVVSYYRSLCQSLEEKGQLVAEFPANLTDRSGPTIKIFKVP